MDKVNLPVHTQETYFIKILGNVNFKKEITPIYDILFTNCLESDFYAVTYKLLSIFRDQHHRT